MSRIHAFGSPRLLIADAHLDIQNLNLAVRDFFRKYPPLLSVYFDPEKGLYVHTARFPKALAENLPVLIRRIAGSLRSALDQAVYASALVLDGKNPSATKFPFADTRQQLDREIRRKCIDVAPEIAELLRQFRPYRDGGNELLWSLNRLRNVNEHRMLVPAIMGGGVSFPFEAADKRLHGVLIPPSSGRRWDGANNVLTFDSPAAIEAGSKYKPIGFIAFAAPDCVAGRPVIHTLYDFSRITETCVESIELETRRLSGS
jgi:hypothetical protein